MKKLGKNELKEIIQSGHILLIGAGCFLDYLTTLNDIENRMNEETTREQAQKDYYKLVKNSKSCGNSISCVSIEQSTIALLVLIISTLNQFNEGIFDPKESMRFHPKVPTAIAVS